MEEISMEIIVLWYWYQTLQATITTEGTNNKNWNTCTTPKRLQQTEWIAKHIPHATVAEFSY